MLTRPAQSRLQRRRGQEKDVSGRSKHERERDEKQARRRVPGATVLHLLAPVDERHAVLVRVVRDRRAHLLDARVELLEPVQVRRRQTQGLRLEVPHVGDGHAHPRVVPVDELVGHLERVGTALEHGLHVGTAAAQGDRPAVARAVVPHSHGDLDLDLIEITVAKREGELERPHAHAGLEEHVSRFASHAVDPAADEHGVGASV
jgi:hypothetical protein